MMDINTVFSFRGVPSVPDTEVSKDFIQGMINRMGVSFFKYGPIAEGFPDKIDAIASLKERLRLYEETGNLEWLVDCANFCMIENIRPRHPKAHFRSTSADESPGRSRLDGVTDAAARNIPESG